MYRVSSRKRSWLVLATLLGLVHASSSWADAFRWTGDSVTGGGLYSEPAHWQRLTDTGTPIAGGGPPEPGRQVLYQTSGNYTIEVDIAATHGVTGFAAGNANTTLNITGPGYLIPSQVRVGSSAGTTNNLTVTGSNFSAATLQIAPSLGTGTLTLNAPMQSNIVVVSGQDATPGFLAQVAGGPATLTLNSGANLTTKAILAYNVGAGTSLVFNGGTLTIEGDGRFNNPAAATFTQIGNGVEEAVLNLYNGDLLPGAYSFRATDTLTINTNATVNYDAPSGILSVGDIQRETVGGQDGDFNWVAGQIELLSASLAVSNDGQFGSSIDLNLDRSLSISGGTTVVSGSVLSISGGQLQSNSLTNAGGSFTFSSGGLFLASGGLEIGPSGITNPSAVVLQPNDAISLPGVLNITSGRSVQLSGGSLSVGSIAGAGSFSYVSGYLEISDGDLGIDSITLTPSDAIVIAQDLTVGLGETVTLNGGSLAAGRKAGGGQLEFVAGNLTFTNDDLSFGPTGDITGPVIVAGGSSVQLPAGTLTVQPTQQFAIDGGYVNAQDVVINSDVHVSNGDLAARTITLGGVGGPGQLTVAEGGQVYFSQSIVLNHLIVAGGVVQGSYDQPEPGEENPVIDNSIAAGYNQDGQLTINDGFVSAPNVRIGITPGFVGTATLNGGELTTDNFIANQGAQSVVNFNGGTLNSAHSEVDGTSPFVIGNGVSEAKLNLLNSGTHNFVDGLVVSPNAELTGSGSITGNVSNGGLVSPGEFGVGTISIEGDLVTTGTLAFDIESVDFFDQLTVSSNLNAGGGLTVSMPFYVPVAGDLFELLDAGSVTGTFSVLDLPVLPAGLVWDASQLYAQGALSVSAGAAVDLAGDYNSDGLVNLADYTVWRDNLGASITLPNDSTPGSVTSDDYSVWKTNFGSSAGPGDLDAIGGNQVPEPASALTLLALLSCLIAAHRFPSRCAAG